MVEGLELFRDRFSQHSDQYTLIGGAACEIVLDQAGIPFRATKDLDVVLSVEALSDDFVAEFWRFVNDGGYEHKFGGTEQKQFYRFYKPSTDGFPYMLELFSRQPDALTLTEGSHLTPIPVDDPIYSLSAILLDDQYYEFINNGRIFINDYPVVTAERLLSLKAKAWCELTDRKASGGAADSRDIRKHRNDIFRLYRVIDPEFNETTPPNVHRDLKRFTEDVAQDQVNLTDFGVSVQSLEDVLSEIRRIYALD